MRADDLLLLLEVARSRSFVQTGHSLGLDHTTISRRITGLEKQLGNRVVDRNAHGIELTELGRSLLPCAEQIERALDRAEQTARPDRQVAGHVRISAPEGFGIRFVAPVMARLHRRHPSVTLELVTATRPLGQGAASDIEIGVGTPDTRRFEVVPISSYVLALYASAEYLQAAGVPLSAGDLSAHSLVYYIDSLQRVTDLDLLGAGIPAGAVHVSSTNVFAHLEATRAGAGIGLLPAFIAAGVSTLRPVLPDTVRLERAYVALVAPQVLRRPAAVAFMTELQQEVQARRHELIGTPAPS